MYRFDLDTAIAAWRQSLSRNPAFRPDDLDELEMHLRDEVEHLVREGHDTESAWRSALSRLGNHADLEHAFRPRYTGVSTRRPSPIRDAASALRLAGSHLRIALRTIRRDGAFSAINIGGLALGLATCLVIGLHVADELGYDRFHADADRIFRLETESGGQPRAHLGYRTPAQLAERAPGVARFVRLHRRTPLVGTRDVTLDEDRFYFADSTFFSFFSFDLIRGEADNVLRRPFSVVVSASAAARLFGDADPVGRIILYDREHELTVTGVMVDPPDESHIHPRFVASMSTLPHVSYERILQEWGVFYGYVKLATGADPAAVRTVFDTVVNDRPDDDDTVRLMPLTDIYLHSRLEDDLEPGGDIRTVRLLGLTALLILLIACINYVNLSTARATRRAREIGIRKVAGAGRAQLVGQYLGESMLTAFFALTVAVVAIILARGPLESLADKSLVSGLADPAWLGVSTALALIVGAAAGGYPAFVLARFMPASVLKSSLSPDRGGRTLRKGLVVLQFGVSIILVVGAMTLLMQLRYIQSKSLGFDGEQVVVVDVHDERVGARYSALRHEWTSLPGVVSMGMSASTVPGESHSGSHRLRRPGTDESDALVLERNWIDDGYLETLSIDILAGRMFTFEPLERDAVMLNEAAVRALGFESPGEAVGRTVLAGTGADPRPLTVTGVTADYHYESLHRRVGPLMLTPFASPSRFVIRLAPAGLDVTMNRLEEAWSSVSDAPFVFAFLDDDIRQLYEADRRRGRLITAGGILAVLVACLGLLGLAAWTVDRRRREIGVRKVLGASAPRIVLLVTGDFLAPVAVAVVLAVPAATLVDRLLSDFAYRAEVGSVVYLTGAGLLLVTAAATVSLHTLRAARTDPATCLRSE